MFKLPAHRLFAAVVVAAEGGEVALAGAAALVVGGCVVQVAADRGLLAAGSTAGGRAGGDEVLQTPTWLVTRLLVAVVAGAAGQRVDGEGEAPGGQALQCAGARGAAVSDGLAVVGGDGEAAAGGGVGGCGGGEVPGQAGVDGAEPGEVAWFGGQAEQGGQRDGQVEPRGQPALVSLAGIGGGWGDGASW